jgi:hypothetical protein
MTIFRFKKYWVLKIDPSAQILAQIFLLLLSRQCKSFRHA